MHKKVLFIFLFVFQGSTVASVSKTNGNRGNLFIISTAQGPRI